MTTPVFDRQDQLDQVTEALLEGEEVIAVYDCVGTGTGFIALTTLRVVLQDKTFVGKQVALTSIPYRHVRSVSVVSDKSLGGRFFSSSSIAVDTGGNMHQAEFRGHEKAHHAHNTILWYITR